VDSAGLILFTLAAMGLPLLGVAAWTMPPLTGHLGGPRRRPLAQLLDTLTYPSHRPALALTAVLMFGAFSVIPYISVSYVSNAGRLVSSVSLITASIEPRRRGGFMSVNSSVQHIASGPGTVCGGLILEGGAGGPLLHFGTVGILAVAVTLTSLWFAGRVRPASPLSMSF
jgi:predicted MFS family arabinose efflux permease